MARRIALIANTAAYLGPDLARMLADRDHDLVIGDPAPELVAELSERGATVEVVSGVSDLIDPSSSQRLVEAALDRFGQIDAATAFTGAIVVGRFMNSSPADLARATSGCLEAPYHFLRAVTTPMVARREGQVLMLTSASGARTTPGAPLYSSVRAAANHLVRNVAAELASTGVQINALGTNFMDFPAFLEASGATDPDVRARIERQVPMGRLGTLEECAALCAAFLDGSNRFVTGQFLANDGGWSV